MSILNQIQWRFLPHHTYFRVCAGATAKIGRNVSIRNSRIIITPGSSLEIADNVSIENAVISVTDGKCFIGLASLIGSRRTHTMLNIENGAVVIGHHSNIEARRLWVRFGGCLTIGNHSNVNIGSEIRCDERITIGDYDQISYNVNIWDTNTHQILSTKERREVADRYYPFFGKEVAKPSTKPVSIGNDCWIGQNSTLLKGSNIGNEVIVGYNTIIPGRSIPDNVTVVPNIDLKIVNRKK